MAQEETAPQHPEMTTEVMFVDLAVAEEFLKANQEPEEGVEGTNRRASQAKVEQYSAIMLAGGWYDYHPQGIGFDWDGNLGDGQKRLKAIVLAAQTKPDIGFWMNVSWNVDPAIFANAVDLQQRRTPADFLTMSGKVNVTQLAAVLKQLFCYHYVPFKGAYSWKNVPLYTPLVQRHTLDEFPRAEEACRIAGTNNLKGIINSTAAGTLLVLAWKYRPEVDVDTFFTKFKTGTNLFPGDPILTLREFLRNSERRKRTVTSVEALAMGIKVLEKWHKGEALYKLHWNESEPMPDIRKK